MNPYAARLAEFPGGAFNGADVFLHRGSWRDHFSDRVGFTPQKLIFEIGCSNGLFLVDAALFEPKTAFVGADWKYKVLYRAAKRAYTAAAKNAVFLRTRAQEITKLFGPGELDEVLLLFPDPWAKSSQLKHRLVQESFLKDIAFVLKPGGRLRFKTDHPGYFQWVLALLGVPPPELPSYDGPELDQKSKRARQVRVRRTMRAADLPQKAQLGTGFALTVTCQSTDFWSDPRLSSWQTQGASPIFTQKTLFERLFVSEGLPVYYVEIQRSL
jgi:tRNA (guanine-N(7)-)-methyltransferase